MLICAPETWLPTIPRELQPGAKIQRWALPLLLPNLLPQQLLEEFHTGKGRETREWGKPIMAPWAASQSSPSCACLSDPLEGNWGRVVHGDAGWVEFVLVNLGTELYTVVTLSPSTVQGSRSVGYPVFSYSSQLLASWATGSPLPATSPEEVEEKAFRDVKANLEGK